MPLKSVYYKGLSTEGLLNMTSPEISKKIVRDYASLREKVLAHKTLGHRIVCTVGSWDMLHIGHLRYLNRAKSLGDVLVVGADSDRGIKSYKGPLRPIIPETERMEMLSYQSCVDYVTLVDDVDDKGNWQYEIIKTIPIDVFVAVEGNSYTEEQKKVIGELCARLEVLPRQAESTSTTDVIQNVLKGHLLDMIEQYRA